MRKNVFGRQFKRDSKERKALFKSLLSSLVMHEGIRTTEAKAKAIKGEIDKLITKAKTRGEQGARYMGEHLFPEAIEKLIQDVAPRFAKRPGGYTRILRLGKRQKDDALMVRIELVEKSTKLQVSQAEKTLRPVKANKKTKKETTEKPEETETVETTVPAVAQQVKRSVQKETKAYMPVTQKKQHIRTRKEAK